MASLHGDALRCFDLDLELVWDNFDRVFLRHCAYPDLQRQGAFSMARLLKHSGFSEFAVRVDLAPGYTDLLVFAQSPEREQDIADKLNRCEMVLLDCDMPEYN